MKKMLHISLAVMLMTAFAAHAGDRIASANEKLNDLEKLVKLGFDNFHDLYLAAGQSKDGYIAQHQDISQTSNINTMNIIQQLRKDLSANKLTDAQKKLKDLEKLINFDFDNINDLYLVAGQKKDGYVAQHHDILQDVSIKSKAIVKELMQDLKK